MNAAETNPPSNILKAGVKEEDIQDAVAASGYPLQTVAARIFRKYCEVQEEWSFFDPEERVLRSTDLIAERRLYQFQEPHPRVRPTLNLLVECKRSELPYVFFLADQGVSAPMFPFVAGLRASEIHITSDDDPSTWVYQALYVLGLEKLPFLQSAIACATTFSRCERQGPKLRLSGSEPYNSLVQPLIKAVEHFGVVETPPKTAVYFDMHFVIPLAVLDAPMIGARIEGAASTLQLLPWVRIPRHHGLNLTGHEHRRNVFAIDVVHIDFLETYIRDHLMPFADEVGKRALKHDVELAEGQGFASGMGKHWHEEIESRLVPRKLRDAAKRVSAAVGAIRKRSSQRGKGRPVKGKTGDRSD